MFYTSEDTIWPKWKLSDPNGQSGCCFKPLETTTGISISNKQSWHKISRCCYTPPSHTNLSKLNQHWLVGFLFFSFSRCRRTDPGFDLDPGPRPGSSTEKHNSRRAEHRFQFEWGWVKSDTASTLTKLIFFNQDVSTILRKTVIILTNFHVIGDRKKITLKLDPNKQDDIRKNYSQVRRDQQSLESSFETKSLWENRW